MIVSRVVRQMSLCAEVVAAADGRYRELGAISRAVLYPRSVPDGRQLRRFASTIRRTWTMQNIPSAITMMMMTSPTMKTRAPILNTVVGLPLDVRRRRLAVDARTIAPRPASSTRMCSAVDACVAQRLRDGVRDVDIHSFPLANRHFSTVAERK